MLMFDYFRISKMSNVLTQQEILEQYGDLPLYFRSCNNSHLIFSSKDNLDTFISMFIEMEEIQFLDVDNP